MCLLWQRLSPLAIVLLLVGCATAPPPLAPGAAAAWLGGTPRVVVRLDASQVTAWNDVTNRHEALKTVGGRTKTVWLGFELSNLDDIATAAETVRVVLEGDFPKGAASLLLDWNGSWKKGTGVWTNQTLGLSVSLPQDNLVAVRRNDTAPASPAEGVLRDLDPAALTRAAAWVSFWSPGEALFGTTGAKLIPISRLDVVLSRQGAFLEGPIILLFADERAAQVAAVFLKLLSGQVRSRLGQDLEWRAEGARVVGTTLRIKQDDLKSLAEKLVAEPTIETGGAP